MSGAESDAGTGAARSQAGTPGTTATPTSTGPGCAAACPTTRSTAARTSRSQHRVGPDPVQRAPQRGRRAREARRLRGRRHPAEPAGRVAGRDAGPADRDALAQHGRDGRRGDAARQPDRRRRAARRLRQDDPGAADGRRVGRPARRRRARRADAHRHLPRRRRSAAAPTCGGCREEVRAGTLSEDDVPALRVVDDPQPGALQHDGHRVDDGPASPRRSGTTIPGIAGTPAPDSRLLEARARRPAGWPSSWSPRTGGPSTVLTPRLVPQRDRRAGRDRRLHQRRRPPARDRRPARAST